MSDKILRTTDAARRLSVSNTTLWRLSQLSDFPRKVVITSRIVGFKESELADWLNSRQQGGV